MSRREAHKPQARSGGMAPLIGRSTIVVTATAPRDRKDPRAGTPSFMGRSQSQMVTLVNGMFRAAFGRMGSHSLLAIITIRHYFARVMFSVARANSRWFFPFLAVAAVAGIGVTAAPLQVGPPLAIRLVDAGNPLWQPFYVDPVSAAMGAHNANPGNAQLTAIATTPQAYWLDQAFPAGSVGGRVASYAGAAAAAGSMPVFTLYGIPHRDCGSYASGGFASGADYRQWIDSISSGLGGSPAALIVEPDALDMADCLSVDQRQERFDLIRYAVDTLTRDPAAAVYVDGGHSRWLSAEEIAARLNQVDVGRARGFSLNVSNFFTTDEEVGYGEAVSGLTNGAHYVIDTSRNGAGPSGDSAANWCNPSGRALGAPPTTAAAGAHDDAYLWIKRPGESDGSCNGGAQAGHFVSQYAIDLAQNAGQ